MMSEEAPVDSSQQQQTQATTSTGGGAESLTLQESAVVSSLMPDNPPAYSDIAKEQEAEQNQPPVTYVPAAAPSGGVPPVQYVIAAPIQQTIPKPNFPGPHDFLMFIVVTIIICAILNVTSLIFGIPALAVALVARDFRQTEKNYLKASRYSTIAVSLAISTICYTMVVSFLIVLVLLIFYGSDYHYILGCRSLEYQAYGGEYRCNYYR